MIYKTQDPFFENLIFAMLGIKLADYDPNRQNEIIEECLAVYSEFTRNYFAANYPNFDIDKIQGVNYNQESSKNISKAIQSKIDSCHKAFLDELTKSWEN